MPNDLGTRRSRPDDYKPDRRDVDRKRERASRRSRSKSVEKLRSPDRKRRRDRTRSRSPAKETLSSVRLDARRAREERPRSRSRSGSRERRERRLRKERDIALGHHVTKSVRRHDSEESTVFATPVMAMEEDDEGALAALMGFSSFDSTKGKKVEGNDVGMATVAVKRKYRQYMNRRGGFNRPLDAVH